MGPKIERIMYIDKTLQKGLKITLKEIAEEFECTTRTAARTIEFMRDRMRAPIEYNYLNEYYEYTQEGYRIFA